MLHIDVIGSGAPLVMLHGWGMHGGVWADTAQKLAADFRVHNVDLPGHGKSSLPSPASGRGAGGEGSAESSLSLTLWMKQLAIRLGCKEPQPSRWLSRERERGLDWLDFIVNELSSVFPEPINLCGWSLGGIIAQHWAACEPDKVQRLVLVSSTPCFAARSDWAFGMPQETLAQFASELEMNHAATLRRFLALQVRGSEGERELLASLREKLFSRGGPLLDALRGGLAILRDTDLRGALPQIRQPTLVIAGERDKLTPPEASHYLAQSLPNARAIVIDGAAHAPFLSHPELFVEQVRMFLKGN